MNSIKKEFVNAKEIWYPSVITEIDTPEGISILQNSYHVPFLLLEGQLEAQEKGSFCGIASSVIALNTLHHDKKFTQSELYQFVVDNFLQDKKDMNYGLSLKQVKIMLEFLGGVEVGLRTNLLFCNVKQEIHATKDIFELSEQFRKDIENCIVKESTTEDIAPSFIICNFWRQLKDHHGGHISPIGAYSKETDEILVLDTNPKRFQPHWISTDLMISSMCTMDRTSNEPRGYLVVKMKK